MNLSQFGEHLPGSNQDQKKAEGQAQCDDSGSVQGCLAAETEAAQLYQSGQFAAAAECYSRCLHQLDIPLQTRISLLQNRSAANLKLKLYDKVLEDCTEILLVEAGNSRALARKIKALCGEGKFIEAHKVSLYWHQIDNTNQQAKKEVERLNIVVKALQDQDADEDELVDDLVVSHVSPDGEAAALFFTTAQSFSAAPSSNAAASPSAVQSSSATHASSAAPLASTAALSSAGPSSHVGVLSVAGPLSNASPSSSADPIASAASSSSAAPISSVVAISNAGPSYSAGPSSSAAPIATAASSSSAAAISSVAALSSAEPSTSAAPSASAAPSSAAGSGASACCNDGEEAAAGMEDGDDLYQCHYCDISFASGSDFRAHCQSEQHQRTVSSDEGCNWKYRPPPRGLTAEEYTKCPRCHGVGSCRFGDQCSLAHSDAELEEWKKRFEYRRQRLQKAKDEEMLQGSSFAEQLLERWMSAANPDFILTSNAEGINIHVNTDLSVTMASKRSASVWTFTVTSKVSLRRLLLLDDANRRHFHIQSLTVGPKRAQKSQKIENLCQEWVNNKFTATRSSNEKVYRIKVGFKTDIYGTFRQSVVFDFGEEPMLVRQLCVDSSPVADIDRHQQDLILNETGRWDLSTKTLIRFEPRPNNYDESDLALLEKFPSPMAAKFTISNVLLQPISSLTYKDRMHNLLYIEEMAQFSSIAKFNIRTSLQLVNRFLLMPSTVSTAKFAQGGELFARMKLNSDLSEDTSQGRLVLQNVSTVYLAPHDSTASENNPDYQPQTVYEALVEEKGKNFIFLRLSAKCVTELQLTADTEFVAQVQFQLNRLPLCEMHEALNLLSNLDVVFPVIDTAAVQIPWNPLKQWNEKLDYRLNLKQKEAIVAVTTDLSRQLPPILIVGPYGTGKTFTLAHAAIRILEQEDNRVLICTHSNSAGDLYVKDYFDPLVKEGQTELRPLRVYYLHRWVQTVNPTVLEYCLVGNEGTTGAMFRKPTKADVEKHRIVVATLSTSRYLFSLDLPPGYFTHILLDEAAQAQECETIMPLVLAGPGTRLVLAGDHMQLGPEIHSDFAREHNLQVSFLERLYDHYPDNHSCKILLCENYRSHKAIINYTSELFYNKKLVASGKQPRHEVYYPLTFFTARGEDMQHQNSTAFYNNSEVYEVVERVVELQKLWPKSWEPLDENSIGVVSPYYDQVIRIRAELRKKKLFSVSVERVLNVQGKQFRAIFLSTVRTRNTCSSDISMEDYMDYGFLSNVKLLNTAITRAQSMVAVVGDPVSLCSIGKCRKLWERFIELCSENNSLHGITWTQLRAQLDGVELKKTYILNPNAPEFIPNRLRHGPFAPLEPVAMGRYGYTFVQTQPGIPSHPHLFRPYVPGYHPQMYAYGRPYGYMYGPWMTPHVPAAFMAAGKQSGQALPMPANIPGSIPGSIPSSLHHSPTSMAALKAGAPVITANKPSCKTRKADRKTGSPHVPTTAASATGTATTAVAVSSASSPAATEAPAPTAAQSQGAALHMGPIHSTYGMPLMPQHTGYHYRMAYMPQYSPYCSMASPYGMMLSPGSQLLQPYLQMMHPSPRSIRMTIPSSSALSFMDRMGESEATGGAQPYQFLPNACNTRTKAGPNSPRSPEGSQHTPPPVTRLLGPNQNTLLHNPSLQKELHSYIQQSEGAKSAASFMKYVQTRATPSTQYKDTEVQAKVTSPGTTGSTSPTKAKPKREVVSVRKLDYAHPVSPANGDARVRSDSGYSSSTQNSSSDQALSPSGSWHTFDENRPPFGRMTTSFNKMSSLPQGEAAGWKTQAMNPSVQVEDDAPDARPPVMDDVMRLMDDESIDMKLESIQNENKASEGRHAPLYMRGASTPMLSYAGALRSQPPTSPYGKLTAAQQTSRTHLMSLLQASGTPEASTQQAQEDSHSSWETRPRAHSLPHPDQQGEEAQDPSPDVPPNPLDVLKNLHIKASPGTQALYQYFS